MKQEQKLSAKKAMRQLIRLVYQDYPFFVLSIFFLTFSVLCIKALSLGLLLPIIEGLESPSNITPAHPLSKFFIGILERMGLSVTLWTLILTGLSFFGVQALLEYGRTFFIAKTAYQVERKMRMALFASLIEAKVDFFNQSKIGTLINGLVYEVHRAASSFIHLTNTFVGAGLLLANVAIAFLISWELSLVTFSLGALLLFTTRKREAIQATGVAIGEANKDLNDKSVEYLSGLREVKNFNLEGYCREGFEKAANDVSKSSVKLGELTARYTFFYEVFAMLILFGVVGLSFYWMETSLPVVITFLAVLFRVAPALTSFQQTRDKFYGTMPGVQAMDTIYDEMNQLSGLHQLEKASPIQDFRSKIVFQNLSFRYPDKEEDVLSDFSLEVLKGSRIAIVGASGAGKTTLIHLLMRFYEPTTGGILIDGEDLREIDLSSWRELLGVVSQETFLFHDSVFNNIRFGNLAASGEAVIAAAKKAHAHEFISQLEEGYETVIGDRGVKLSGGQRQRLAFARAILRDPSILILDEATSELDSKTEQAIQQTLDEMDQERTVFIIAHRLSTIESADKIIVLEGGRVVEEGSHEELLARASSYKEYYETQMTHSEVTK